MIAEHHLSERRACRLVGLSRDCYRNPPLVDERTQLLSAKIVEIAQVRRRFGYRRIHDLLCPEFPGVNHKRVYRLYSQAQLAVRKRKKVRRAASERVPLTVATHFMRYILIQPGRPMQTGYIYSFNGKFRDECLNEHWFETLVQARSTIASWRQDYNQVRPHSSLGRIPPAEFAQSHRIINQRPPVSSKEIK